MLQVGDSGEVFLPHMAPVVKETEVIIFFVGFYEVTSWWVNLFQEAVMCHNGWAPQNDDKCEARLSYMEIGLIEK